MHIDIPATLVERLQRHAAEAGYENVETYVTDFVLTLAEHPVTAELHAPLSPGELAASLAAIDESCRQIEAGEGLTVDEARQRSLEQLKRKLP